MTNPKKVFFRNLGKNKRYTIETVVVFLISLGQFLAEQFKVEMLHDTFSVVEMDEEVAKAILEAIGSGKTVEVGGKPVEITAKPWEKKETAPKAAEAKPQTIAAKPEPKPVVVFPARPVMTGPTPEEKEKIQARRDAEAKHRADAETKRHAEIAAKRAADAKRQIEIQARREADARRRLEIEAKIKAAAAKIAPMKKRLVEQAPRLLKGRKTEGTFWGEKNLARFERLIVSIGATEVIILVISKFLEAQSASFKEMVGAAAGPSHCAQLAVNWLAQVKKVIAETALTDDREKTTFVVNNLPVVLGFEHRLTEVGKLAAALKKPGATAMGMFLIDAVLEALQADADGVLAVVGNARAYCGQAAEDSGRLLKELEAGQKGPESKPKPGLTAGFAEKLKAAIEPEAEAEDEATSTTASVMEENSTIH